MGGIRMNRVLRSLAAGALLCFPSLGNACTSGTVHFWTLDKTLRDDCGGTSLAKSGDIPYSAVPSASKPRSWAGPFSLHQFLVDKHGSDVDTHQGSVEFEFESGISGKSCVIFEMGNGGDCFRWLEAYTYAGTLNVFNAAYNAILSHPFQAKTRYTEWSGNWGPKGTELWMGAEGAKMNGSLLAQFPTSFPRRKSASSVSAFLRTRTEVPLTALWAVFD